MNAGPSTSLHEHSEDPLVLSGTSCVRGEKMLFRNLDLALQPGQAALLTGPNGIGKSSLLRLIAGLLAPFSGTIRKPRTLALCDDRLALDEQLPLADALAFWARIDGRAPDDVAAAMAAADIGHLAEVPIRYFSTGQRQRARLARTFLSAAPLWLLDEPANGLDSASVAKLGTALQRHLDTGGIILAASHIALPVSFDVTLDLQTLVPDEATL